MRSVFDTQASFEKNRRGEVLLLCVNYNSAHSAIRMMDSFFQQDVTNVGLTAICIDNSPGDTDYRRLTERFREYSHARILNPDKNLGYFGGAAFGFKEYLSGAPIPTWTIVSNADVVVESRSLVNVLLERYASDSTMCIAPAILSNRDNRDQNPYMTERPSRRTLRVYTAVYRSSLASVLHQAASMANVCVRRIVSSLRKATARTDPMRIYAPHGSFFALSRSFFASGGNLQYVPFLFGEEVFIAEQVLQRGGDIYYDPELLVRHDEHVSTGWFKGGKMLGYEADALDYLIRTYFSKTKNAD